MAETTRAAGSSAKSKRRRKRWLYGLAIALALAVAGPLAAGPLLGIHTISANEPPLPLPTRGFSHASFGRLLAAIARGDKVDYRALKRRAGDLHRYVATLALVGPNSTPERFPSRSHRLAYYLNAYNALVLLGVLQSWPIASVHQVHGPIEPKAGFGFFWAQRFALDGEQINLYDLENDYLRARFGDARIHAAINCASSSCPALAPRAFEARTLSRQLDAAARAFASHARHVRVDDQQREIVLSAIYDWFHSDFEAHAKEIGAGSTVLDWIDRYADPKVRRHLARARDRRYRLRFADYDWGINTFERASSSGARRSSRFLCERSHLTRHPCINNRCQSADSVLDCQPPVTPTSNDGQQTSARATSHRNRHGVDFAMF